MYQIFLLADQGHKLKPFKSIADWPWTWCRMLTLVRRVQGIYERASLDKEPENAVPPRWMFWERKETDKWFEDRQKYWQEHEQDEREKP